MTLFDLTGKTAIITGATKGIGRAIASRMAEHGANVVISSRKADLCEAVAQDINVNWAKGDNEAAAIPCHISHKEQLQALVDQTMARFGGIDILVCNAAVNPFFGLLKDIPDSAFDKIMETNIKSNHWLCQMASPHIAARGGGSIIIVSSVGGLRASVNLGAYGISKAADMQIARNLAFEYGPPQNPGQCDRARPRPHRLRARPLGGRGTGKTAERQDPAWPIGRSGRDCRCRRHAGVRGRRLR